jgi:hypothetical protein
MHGTTNIKYKFILLLEFCISLLPFTDSFGYLVGNLIRMHKGVEVRGTHLGRQIKSAYNF